MSKIAHIIAIRAGSLGDLGFGISANPGDIEHVLDEGQVWVGPRPVLEEDFDFVQPIPYIVIRDGNRVLAYERGSAGGDARLHSKVSIGFGGHVDVADAVITGDGIIDLRRTMIAACVRELEEELGITITGHRAVDPEKLCAWSHVISSNATPVDRVHVGLVATIDVNQLPAIEPAMFERVIENARWVSADGLVTDAAAGNVTLESWTSLVLSLPSATAA